MTLLSGAARIAGRVGLRFEAATVDHALRPESKDEVALVARLATALGVPHHVLSAPVHGPGIEAAARDARYSALERLRLERGLHAIATAHTASDQAETVLMRLSRGSALSGAAAIAEAREDGVIRPMLLLTRADVEAYVTARKFEVAHDAMNDDPQFLRVRIRREVLPAFVQAAGPGVERALTRFAAHATEDDAELRAQASAALARVSWPDGSIEAASLTSLTRPIARRVMALWLGAQSIELDAELIDDALRAVKERSVATLPGDRLLACTDGRARVTAAPARLHATSSGTHGRSRD